MQCLSFNRTNSGKGAIVFQPHLLNGNHMRTMGTTQNELIPIFPKWMTDL